MHGTRVCQKLSRQVGSTRLTNQFPNGSMNSPARKLIAQQLIENKYLDKEVRENNWRKRRADEHRLITLPNYNKFRNSHIVTCKSKYQKWICSCRAHCVRSYWSCSPGIIRHVECYTEHHIDVENEQYIEA